MGRSANIIAAFGGLCVCGALGTMAPAVFGAGAAVLTVEAAKALWPNLAGDLFGRVVERFATRPDPHAGAKNHDLRQLIVDAITAVIDDFIKATRPTGPALNRVRTIKDTVADRVTTVQADPRFVELAEENVVASFFHPTPDEFQQVRALTVEAWKYFVRHDDNADPHIRSATASLARHLHENLARYLVGLYRTALKDNPQLFAAVQMGVLQNLMLVAQRTVQITEDIRRKLDDLNATVKDSASDGRMIGALTIATHDMVKEMHSRDADRKVAGVYLPRAHNPNFVGRQGEIGDAKALLLKDSTVAITQPLIGEGGIGKTQLAQRVFEDLADVFTGRWWLDCSRDGHRGELVNLAGAMGVEAPPESAYKTLAEWYTAVRSLLRTAMCRGGRHLLVLDNLEPPSVDPADAPLDPNTIIHQLALPAGCAVLITTRWQGIESFILNTRRLDVLSKHDARDLLRKRFRDRKLAIADQWPDADLDALADHVGRHALALDLIATWLFKLRHTPPATLLQQMKASDEDTLALFDLPQLKGSAHGYEKEVAVSLALHLDDPAIKPALPLLYAASVFAPEAIPLDLLAKAAGVEPSKTGELIALLVERSILAHAETAPFPAVNVHRLMQAVVRARLKKNGWFSSALTAVIGALVDLYRDTDWADATAAARTAALPHVAAVGEWVTDGYFAPHFELARLRADAAEHQRCIGQLSGAMVNIESAIAFTEALTLVNERRLAKLYARRAAIRQDAGDLAGAESDIQRSIEWGEKRSVRDEWALAIDYAARADVRRLRGNLSGAESDIQRSIEWGEKQSQRDERIMAPWYTTRARLRRDRGDGAGAESDIQRSIEWGEKQSPRDERSLAIDYATRAEIRRDRGDLAGAEADIQWSIDWGEKQLPRQERDLAIWYATRASIRQLRDDFAGAADDIQRSIEWGEKQIPRDGRELAIRYAVRSDICHQCGDLEGALSDVQRCIEWGEKQSPRDEWGLANWYARRADIHRARGDLTGAESDVQRSINWGERQSPRDERMLTIWYATRSRIRRDMGKKAKAAGDSVAASRHFAEARTDIDAAIAWFEANLPGDERSLRIFYEVRDSIPPG